VSGLALDTDILVIGSGISGLNAAVKSALAYPDRTITVVTKNTLLESNTAYAQGGIAVVTDLNHDTYEKHIEDTLVAGDGLSDRKIVEMVVTEGPKLVKEMVMMGVEFDREQSGEYQLGMEGAHSERRILHHQDTTGFEIQRVLVQQARKLPNIRLLEHHLAIDLITQHHFGEKVTRYREDTRCFGAYVLDLKTREIKTISAGATLLASGGVGQVYEMTTNPIVATGDGVAMAYRAKAWVRDMQFVQFHPTALYGVKQAGRAFLISEAVRGFGGILRTGDEEPFMDRYDERGSLASRDIVARAIDTEMKARGTDHVWLDCRSLDPTELATRFPMIVSTCRKHGINPTEQMIPVAPAAHYLCGGVETDEWGRTSIDRLYACGEVARTGLHGANRLASNSLLEGIVFADRCFRHLKEHEPFREPRESLPAWRSEGTTQPKEWVLISENRQEVQRLMNTYIGIVRSNERMNRALQRMKVIYEESEDLFRHTTVSPQLAELRNLINVAYLIIRQSMEQKENRGTFYNLDLE
jgi:L-aspartate oxidase